MSTVSVAGKAGRAHNVESDVQCLADPSGAFRKETDDLLVPQLGN